MSTRFENYADKHPFVKMERRNGILQIQFHTEGGSLRWGHIGGAHADLAEAFEDIAHDPENMVVIMTGTGTEFSGPKASKETFPRSHPREWDIIMMNGLKLTTSLLNINAPVISCINGPALRHAEIPLLADIVLASDTAVIQDSAHFINRTTPGDGVNIFFPLLMGWNRGRYFLLTGQTLSAKELKEMGLVAEIMPREKLLPRAWELAERLIQQNPLVLRYSRMLFTHPLKKLVHDMLGFGLALEGLAAVDESSGRVGYRWDAESDKH
jgi:enoyl-CoA hydratase/carnithine racemase